MTWFMPAVDYVLPSSCPDTTNPNTACAFVLLILSHINTLYPYLSHLSFALNWALNLDTFVVFGCHLLVVYWPESRSASGSSGCRKYHSQRNEGFPTQVRLWGKSGLTWKCQVVPKWSGDQTRQHPAWRGQPGEYWPHHQTCEPARHRSLQVRAGQLHREGSVRQRNQCWCFVYV